MDDECGESMEPMGKVPLVKLCESELENCSNKTRVRAIATSPGTKDSEIWTLRFTPSPTEKRSIVMSMHVCVCMCLCLSAIISWELHIRFSAIFVHAANAPGSVFLCSDVVYFRFYR